MATGFDGPSIVYINSDGSIISGFCAEWDALDYPFYDYGDYLLPYAWG